MSTSLADVLFLRSYEATATLTTKSICVKTDRTDKCPAKTISETVAVVPILRQGLSAFRSFFSFQMSAYTLQRMIILSMFGTRGFQPCNCEFGAAECALRFCAI